LAWIHCSELNRQARSKLTRAILEMCRLHPISFFANIVPDHAMAREDQAEDEAQYQGKERAWAKEANRLVRSPYCRALAACLIEALVREAIPRRKRLNVILADQPREVGNAALLFDWLKFMPELEPWLGELHQGRLQNPRSVFPLQLADIVAYEVWKSRNERNRVLFRALKTRPCYFGTSTRLLDRWVRAQMA
jgi:hypothetical protein